MAVITSSLACPIHRLIFIILMQPMILLFCSQGLFTTGQNYCITATSQLSVPDPVLIADLFSREGPDFVKRLNGDFAIFIAQPEKKQAYLFRDHVGIRPMAWTVDQQTLCFSSDIIGLCRAFSSGQDLLTAIIYWDTSSI